MFLGEFQHNLDSKFRLTIPSRYRNLLAIGIVVTRSPNEQCLKGYPLAEWEKISSKVDALPNMDRNANALRRSIFSQAELLELDKQGRILISQRLRDYAQIETEVVVAGMSSHLEFWHPKLWEDETSNVDSSMFEVYDI
ncbi:division/cell wall cluster transcriptional repressor MraZ [Chloroflexi bacterium TSY]|nr:division/cell wall cluster transcriptional repressor MraZ [Chloroflexi bacterium TSY]